MKTKLMLLLATALMLTVSVHAVDYETLTLTDGTKYENVTVSKVDPDGLRVTHSKGAAKLPFAKLDADIQKKYNYDPVKAAEFDEKAKATKDAAWDAFYQGKNNKEVKAKSIDLYSEYGKTKEAKDMTDVELFFTTGNYFSGRVIQILGAGILLEAETRDIYFPCSSDDYKKMLASGLLYGNKGIPSEAGKSLWLKIKNAKTNLVLIEDVDTKDIVDDDIFAVFAWKVGTYKYENTQGAIKTVRKYTASIKKAIAMFEKEFDAKIDFDSKTKTIFKSASHENN